MGIIARDNRNAQYDAILTTLPKSRAEVLAKLAECEPTGGATRHELSQYLNRPLSSICGRMAELESAGLVVETEEKRETQFGGMAVVMRIAPSLRFRGYMQGRLFE